jgi:hypothetical protein
LAVNPFSSRLSLFDASGIPDFENDFPASDRAITGDIPVETACKPVAQTVISIDRPYGFMGDKRKRFDLLHSRKLARLRHADHL